jgi:LysM repeat protein
VVTVPVGTPIAQAATQQEEIDPLNMTATAIIQRATQTVAANLTATYFAQFGTPTPTIGPTSTPLPGVTPTAQQTAAPGGPCSYVTVAGDNLFRISLRYGVTINDIAAANGISNPSIILVGQTLTIPGCSGGTNPVTPSAPGPGGSCANTYTTQQGDTLFEISLQFGVPVNSIAAANNISNMNLIFINQQLCIPAA